jgi:hypothetical protein
MYNILLDSDIVRNTLFVAKLKGFESKIVIRGSETATCDDLLH